MFNLTGGLFKTSFCFVAQQMQGASQSDRPGGCVRSEKLFRGPAIEICLLVYDQLLPEEH